MRKNVNSCRVEGYVYDVSKLSLRESGPNSKNPGTVFITGDLEVAVDEAGLNVIPVHFTYVTEVYGKSGKTNSTFTALKKILDNKDATWMKSGKDNATKVRIDGSIALNDFINAEDKRISTKRCEGSFVTIVPMLNENELARNTFQVDMIINRVNHVDANPEKNIKDDFVTVGGAVFNFRNDLLPLEFTVHNAGGMKYFEDLGASAAEPVFTKVWGRMSCTTEKVEQTEEASDWGEAAVNVYERKTREWMITGTAKVPYDFGDETVMTTKELTEAMQNREVMWADIKKRNDEYQASKKATTAPVMANAVVASEGNWTF